MPEEKKPYHALSVIPDIDEIIIRELAKGRSLKSIGDEYGVTDVAVFYRAQQHPEYKKHLQIGLELRMDRREEELERAATNVDVTRSDRLLGHARWLAERQLPERFGPGQKIMGADGGNLVVEIVKYGRTIDQLP